MGFEIFINREMCKLMAKVSFIYLRIFQDKKILENISINFVDF